jgi:hypothetical protein
VPVLPGHQKRLLLAAPQLRELRAQKRHADAGVAVPDLVPADSASHSPLQESVGQLSTGAASQVAACLSSASGLLQRCAQAAECTPHNRMYPAAQK